MRLLSLLLAMDDVNDTRYPLSKVQHMHVKKLTYKEVDYNTKYMMTDFQLYILRGWVCLSI